jgi:hypothetical protein
MCAWWSRGGRSETPAGCSLASIGNGRSSARSAIGFCSRQILLDRNKGASQWTTDHRQAHRRRRQQTMEALGERNEMELTYRCAIFSQNPAHHRRTRIGPGSSERRRSPDSVFQEQPAVLHVSGLESSSGGKWRRQSCDREAGCRAKLSFSLTTQHSTSQMTNASDLVL